MALHINLLHEAQSKIVEEKRDPLKLGILAMLVIAVCFYGYYLFRAGESKKIAREKSALEAENAQLAPQATQAQADEAAANLSVQTTGAVEKIINDRFYWGPLFSEIFAGTGPEIQITSFEGSTRSPEAVSLTVIGISAGREPRAVAERFRQSMEERLNKVYGKVTSQFVSLENSEVPLVLNGKSFAMANFSIGFQLSLQPKP